MRSSAASWDCVAVSVEILRDAQHVVEALNARGFDAIDLASAYAFQARLNRWLSFRSFLISVFQINLRNIAFHNHFCSERTGGVCHPLQDITGLIACGRLGQAASLEEQIVRVFVVKVGFSLSNLIQHDRMERY